MHTHTLMASLNTPVRITDLFDGSAKRARMDNTEILEEELVIEEFVSQIGEQPMNQIGEQPMTRFNTVGCHSITA